MEARPLDAAGDNRPVSTLERPMPPLNADERTTLESWLDFHRTTLAMKCEGLDDEQAAVASAPTMITSASITRPTHALRDSRFRRFRPRPAIMRHDRGLAASPRVRYTLKLAGRVYPPPGRASRVCGAIHLRPLTDASLGLRTDAQRH
jgi:hypothetical protein